MKKKIKIIDILCKINCNEEVPYKIKYNDIEYKYDYEIQDYYTSDGKFLFETLFTNIETQKLLDKEVEILDKEDEFEDIEEVDLGILNDQSSKNKEFKNRINQLIKNQKKIISRLKDE